jgi:hypothetical protein
MENLTQDQIVQSISAAFDSVNLINQINNQEEKSQDDLDTLDRNVKHLRIMMAMEWFYNALTEEQKEEILSLL